MKRMSLMKKYTINEKNKITFNLFSTYSRIKNYILGVFLPFLKEVKEETRAEIKLRRRVALVELEHAYISNEDFFSRLRVFCTESVKSIENIEQMLINTISSIPERIVSAIKLLPRSKLVEEYFSYFNKMYIDNESLLKVKLVFYSVQEKIINDIMLKELVVKISSDMVDNFGDGKAFGVSNRLYSIINSYFVNKKLRSFGYIRKLVRKEIPTLLYNLRDSFIVMHNDKIEVADKKIKYIVFEKFKSELLGVSLRLYKRLCFKAYKSIIGT